MSVDSFVYWTFVVAWFAVAGVFFFGIVPRIITEIGSILGHVTKLVDRSALPLLIAKAEGDLSRIESSGTKLTALTARAQAAVVLIRTTPLVPVQIAQLIARVRVEVAAFRKA